MGKRELVCDCEVIHEDIVNKVKKNMLNEEILLMMADFYKAFQIALGLKL